MKKTYIIVGMIAIFSVVLVSAYVMTAEIRAQDATGLKLCDDGGNCIKISDGGNLDLFGNRVINVSDATYNHNVTVEGNLSVDDILRIGDYPAELTILNDNITLNTSYFVIDTENDTAADNLECINGVPENELIFFQTASDTRDVTLVNGYAGCDANNRLRLPGAGITLDTRNEMVGCFHQYGKGWMCWQMGTE